MLLHYLFYGVYAISSANDSRSFQRWVVNAARPRRGFLTAIPIDVRVFHPALNNAGHPVFRYHRPLISISRVHPAGLVNHSPSSPTNCPPGIIILHSGTETATAGSSKIFALFSHRVVNQSPRHRLNASLSKRKSSKFARSVKRCFVDL